MKLNLYKTIRQKFSRNDTASRLLRGLILVHHGDDEYQSIFDQITAVYRHHLLNQQIDASINLSKSQLKLSHKIQQELNQLTADPAGQDIATYAEFLIFDFHQS